jgi:diacylglycerol kinase (ATP)
MGLPGLDWAHWFALEEAAERLARGSVRLVDLGMCADRAFLLWAGVGLDGQIVNSIEPRGRLEKTFGTVHYGLSALWNSLNWTGIDLRVRCGPQVWEDRFLVAIASNIRSYAGGLMELSPDALVDDGLLDFWLITGRSMVDAVYRVVQVLLGMHVDAPGVTHFQADEAVFETPGKLSMQFDGEPGIIPSPAEFRVRRRQLRVLVPTESAPEVFSTTARAPGPPV